MAREPELIKEIRGLVRERGRWPLDAYLFVYQAIETAQRLAGERRHVSPKELLEGFKVLSQESFGPLALTVLREWRIEDTRDVGQMVFDMVERGLMTKTDDDKLEDFAGVFDLEATFEFERLSRDLDSGKLPAYRPAYRPFPGKARPAVSAALGGQG